MATAATLDEGLLARYLAALGVRRRDPSPEALHELVMAHVTHVPFENISKLYYWKRLGLAGVVPIGRFLEGIEKHHFGGTCYANNFHFCTLLASLGYEARLCGADMTNPDVHIVIMVAVGGREYLVDGGYGGPFLAPMPRDLDRDYAIQWGRDRYVLEPQDAAGRSRLKLYKDGVATHGYLVKPTPRTIEDFADVIAASFRPEATFMNAMLLVRYYRARSVTIHNLNVIETQGSASTERTVTGPEELIATIVREFGMPREIVVEVVGELANTRNAWA